MEWLLRYIPSFRSVMSQKGNDNDAHGLNHGSDLFSPLVSIAPYEHPVIFDYLGKDRYLQASFCKAVRKLYSAKFGMYTTRTLSNIAAEEGFVGVLEWSKDIGCRWNESLLISGAEGGHVDILKFLKNNDCPMPDGNAAWIAAAKRGNLEVIKFAHDSGYMQDIDPYLCDVAAENDRLNVLKWVHEVEGNDYFDADTCEQAANGGFLEIIQWLRGLGCDWDQGTCRAAVLHGHVDVLKWALDNGCPWGVNDWIFVGGITGLHLAQNVGVIEILISRGADINAVDDSGCTPLHINILRGNLEAVKTLVRLCADVNIPCAEGVTPLDMAIGHRHREIVEVLRAAGARESV